MRKMLDYLKDNAKGRERERFLNNFYTKKIKNGKTTRADYLDKIFIGVSIFVFVIYLLNKLISNLIISIFIGVIITIILIKKMISINKRNRLKKIEEIKIEFRTELEKEISDDENIEDYIIERYYEKKTELKSNMDLLGKDKVFKLYFLFIIFFFGSYLVKYSIYYKIIAIFAFIGATLIGSYNITEYIRGRDCK